VILTGHPAVQHEILHADLPKALSTNKDFYLSAEGCLN
jgi:hypothetical protein